MGTYGLGVIKVRSFEDVKSWNYKSRKKMKASKGGRKVQKCYCSGGNSYHYYRWRKSCR